MTIATSKPARQKRCKHCRGTFAPSRPLQSACSPVCAQRVAEQVREKAERRQALQGRKQARALLEAMKSIPQLIGEADKAFCAFIRARDTGKPCICCGRYSTGWTRGGEWDAGHYRSRGAASHLRYDERNCHAQLKQCNRRAFDVSAYRANLVERIGCEAVKSLESDNEPHKWTKDELRQIRDAYRRKVKELAVGGINE